MRVIRISELQMKDVINISDGKRLGNIGDIEIDIDTGRFALLLFPNRHVCLGFLGKT